MTQTAVPMPVPVITTSDDDASSILIQSVEEDSSVAVLSPIVVQEIATITEEVAPIINVVQQITTSPEPSPIVFDVLSEAPKEVAPLVEAREEFSLPIVAEVSNSIEAHEHPEDFITASLDNLSLMLA
jgi:hypothetical protein